MTSLSSQPMFFSETELPLMSFAGASRAKTSATQETKRALLANAVGSGSNIIALLASFDRKSLSWRTSELCFIEGYRKYSEALPPSGMMRGGKLYQLKPLVFPMSASAYGSWPTPTKSDAKRVTDFKLSSLAKRCHGIRGNKWNFAEHVAAECDGFPTASFALSIMGFPPTWADLEPQETP